MTSWIVDPATAIEIRLDYPVVLTPDSASAITRYTTQSDNKPHVAIGTPQPFDFTLECKLVDSATFEDIKRKLTYLEKNGVQALLILGNEAEAMLGYVELSKFPRRHPSTILNISTKFAGIGNIYGYTKEAENCTLSGCTASADTDASNAQKVVLDAQNDSADFSITQSSWALPIGDYTMYVRAKDSAQVSNDLTLSVYNTTDAASVATGNKTCTASYAWYSLDFSIAAGQSGDAIRFRANKNTATANSISVDLIAVVMRS